MWRRSRPPAPGTRRDETLTPLFSGLIRHRANSAQTPAGHQPRLRAAGTGPATEHPAATEIRFPSRLLMSATQFPPEAVVRLDREHHEGPGL
jgi:hypothetical protein